AGQQRRRRLRRHPRSDAHFADRAAGARKHAVAHRPDEARGALHDGRWRRADRERRLGRRLHRIQRAVGLRGDEGVHHRLHALALTAPIASHPRRILPGVIEELAESCAEAQALLSDRERLTYRALAERSNRYARWALEQGLAKGETVCLLMPNRPEYMAIWLGVTRVGAVVSLLNTNLVGPSLAHCIKIVAPRHIIVAAELIDRLATALPGPGGAPRGRAQGAG